MIGVPAAGAATTAALFLAGVALLVLAVLVTRSRVAGWGADARVVAVAAGLSLVALPWIAWRFVEDLRTTTRYDAYTRESSGPIQAYLPGYLVAGARERIPPDGTWSVAVGPSGANELARSAFPSLVLVTLFPRVSAPLDRASWLVAWGVDPRRVTRVRDVRVVHPRLGPLPPVVLARTSR